MNRQHTIQRDTILTIRLYRIGEYGKRRRLVKSALECIRLWHTKTEAKLNERYLYDIYLPELRMRQRVDQFRRNLLLIKRDTHDNAQADKLRTLHLLRNFFTPWRKWSIAVRGIRILRERNAFRAYRARVRSWVVYSSRRIQRYKSEVKKREFHRFVTIMKQRIADRLLYNTVIKRLDLDRKVVKKCMDIWIKKYKDILEMKRLEEERLLKLTYAFNEIRQYANVSYIIYLLLTIIVYIFVRIYTQVFIKLYYFYYIYLLFIDLYSSIFPSS